MISINTNKYGKPKSPQEYEADEADRMHFNTYQEYEEDDFTIEDVIIEEQEIDDTLSKFSETMKLTNVR